MKTIHHVLTRLEEIVQQRDTALQSVEAFSKRYLETRKELDQVQQERRKAVESRNDLSIRIVGLEKRLEEAEVWKQGLPVLTDKVEPDVLDFQERHGKAVRDIEVGHPEAAGRLEHAFAGLRKELDAARKELKAEKADQLRMAERMAEMEEQREHEQEHEGHLIVPQAVADAEALERSNLRAENAQLSRSNATLVKERDQALADLDDLRAKHTGAERRAEEYRTQLAAGDRELTSLRNASGERMEALAAANATIVTQKARIQTVEADLDRANETIERKDTLIAGLRRELEAERRQEASKHSVRTPMPTDTGLYELLWSENQLYWQYRGDQCPSDVMDTGRSLPRAGRSGDRFFVTKEDEG